MVSNPEFLKEGAAIEDFLRPDRIVVGTDNPRTGELLRALYAPFNRNRDRVMLMDVRSAELTKYAANAMLATKISFMNELANIAESVGADIEKVRVGIGSDPRIGYQFIYPGCWLWRVLLPQGRARTGEDRPGPRLRREDPSGRRVRQSAPEGAPVHQDLRLLQRGSRRAHRGPLGLSFKPNTDDMREASSRTLMEALWQAGARVRAYDPAAMEETRRIYGARDDLVLVEDAMEALEGADTLAVLTEWSQFRSPSFDEIKSKLRHPVIFDGRNILDPRLANAAGLTYVSIGRLPSEPE